MCVCVCVCVCVFTYIFHSTEKLILPEKYKLRKQGMQRAKEIFRLAFCARVP
jgi:hypothetical protein